MKRRFIVIGALVSASLVALVTLRTNKAMWIVYFKEAMYNTQHPYCPPLPAGCKPLLRKNTFVEARANLATIQIFCLDDQTRRYRWRESPAIGWEEETVRLKGGDGSKLSYPGNRSEDLLTFFGLKHNLIAFEGEQNCKNQSELNYWLRNYWLTHGAVYTSSGLLIGCDPVGPAVEVIQLKLNGEIPTDLPGARDSAVTISSLGRQP